MYLNLIRCQELFDELCYSHHLNPYKLDNLDIVDRTEWFVELINEFQDIENANKENPEYDWIWETEKFFIEKIKEKLG